MNLVLFGGAHGRETVDLVKEDDARLAIFGFLKEEAELALGFADPFGEAVGAFAHEEGCVETVRCERQSRCIKWAYIFVCRWYDS